MVMVASTLQYFKISRLFAVLLANLRIFNDWYAPDKYPNNLIQHQSICTFIHVATYSKPWAMRENDIENSDDLVQDVNYPDSTP